MRKNFVPVAAREVLSLGYRVGPGDTPSRISRGFGRGWSGYAELVGANLDVPLALDRMPQGHAATFAQLVPGQVLRLPAAWGRSVAAKSPGVRIERLAATDAVTQAAEAGWALLLKPYVSMGLPAPFAAYKARILNASTSWFRQHAKVAPTPEGLNAYTNSAIAWSKLYGVAVPHAQADNLPWNEIPWGLVPFNAVPWGNIDWLAMAVWAKKNVPPGVVKNPLPDYVPWEKIDWAAAPKWKTIPWPVVPWAIVPWSLIPWGNIDWAAVKNYPTPIDALKSQMQAYIQAKQNKPSEETAPCLPPRLMVNGQCICPAPGLVWNPTTKACEPKTNATADPCVAVPGVTVKDPVTGHCVPVGTGGTDDTPPKKEGFPWLTLVFLTVAAGAAAVATGLVDNVMKPASKKARK